MYNSNMRSNKKTGAALVEVVVVASIVTLLTVAITGVINQTVVVNDLALRNTQAGYILEEGAEAVKIIRDNSWSNITGLTAGTNYYLGYSSGVWSLSATPSTVDTRFTRIIVISAVNRDGNDDIASSGTNDTGTKKVTVTVSWLSAGNTVTKTLAFYVSDILS